jgi:cyanophycinase
VLDHPDHIGVGIDEETAVVVTGGAWEVVGRSQVLVLDARRASTDPAGKDKPTAANARLHLLKDGMKWTP